MSTLFKGLRANIQGGIGSQLLRTMACAGEAIYNQIKPENVLVEVNKYDSKSEKYCELSYHNKEKIEEYIQTKMIFTIKRKKFVQKSYNFDKNMISLLNNWLRSPAKDEYLNISENFYFSSTDHNQNEHVIWARGKDRTSNLKAFEQITLNIKQKHFIRVISNDENFINNSDLLKKYYKSNPSIVDFKNLINARNIYTQMSGYCIAPFLISKKEQTLYLLDKKLHRKEEFPFLEKDWDFFIELLSIYCQINPNKQFRVLRMV